MKHCAVALLAAFAAQVAVAAPIYRCGQTYQQSPCPGGQLIDSADPRTAAQRSEARRVSEREKRLAARMERERLATEKAAKPATANGFDSRAASAPEPAASVQLKSTRKRGKSKTVSDKDLVAVDPTARKATK
jgi:hypothetical protein